MYWFRFIEEGLEMGKKVEKQIIKVPVGLQGSSQSGADMKKKAEVHADTVAQEV